MKIKPVLLLFIFNCVLLITSWIMVLYAYPRLPQKMALWLNFFGKQPLLLDKSLLFFLYPIAQTFFFIFFFLVSRKISSKIKIPPKISLFKEYVFLTLIFFHLIFIHVERSLILFSHQVEKGVDKYYFYSLFGIILILIPYYRIRKKMLAKKLNKNRKLHVE